MILLTDSFIHDEDSDTENIEPETEPSTSGTSDAIENKNEKKKSYKHKQHFRDNWKIEFKWVEERHDRIICVPCQQLLQGNRTYLERDQKTSKHQKACNKLLNVEKITDSSKKADTVPTDLENIMVMCAVEHNVSFISLNHLTKLIKEAAKNHHLYANFKIIENQRDKNCNIIFTTD